MNRDSIVCIKPDLFENESSRPTTRSERERHWFALVIEWEQCKESQEAFCQRHGIKVPTFSYWRTQYLAKKASQQKPKAFVPVIPDTAARAMKLKPIECIQILLPNGIKLQLPLTMASKEILTLINGLGHHHAI